MYGRWACGATPARSGFNAPTLARHRPPRPTPGRPRGATFARERQSRVPTGGQGKPSTQRPSGRGGVRDRKSATRPSETPQAARCAAPEPDPASRLGDAPRALFEAADDIQARNLRRRLAHAPRQRHQATRPDCHRSAMSTSTCLGTTRSRCRRLPRAANFGHGEPKVNRDPADTYCRAAVDSPHRTSPFGCPDRASDQWPTTLRRCSSLRTACLEADCRGTAVGPGSAKKSSSGTGFSNAMLSGSVIRARPLWGWPRVWFCLSKQRQGHRLASKRLSQLL